MLEGVGGAGVATQLFELVLRLSVNMGKELRTDSIKTTRIKPIQEYRLDRLAHGAMCGLRRLGYGLPVRKVREHNRKEEVTLPAYAARELRVVAGNFIVWCCTDVPGVLEIAEVAAVYERDVDGLPILGRLVTISKVRKSSKSYEVTIPKEAQAELGDVNGEQMTFNLTNYPGVVAVSVVKRPNDSAGSRRGG